MDTFFDRLEDARRSRSTTLCVGIDPRLEKIAPELRKGAGDDVETLLTRFGLEIIDLVAEDAACIKPQIGFFEAHGLAGLKAYVRIIAAARDRGVPVIGDVKRGDIGSTASAYAAGHLTPGSDLEVDAITVNPYLGADALEPFVRAAAKVGKGLYVLVRTSNPGAADLQEIELVGDGGPLYERTASLVEALGRGAGAGRHGLLTVGAVVGATAPGAGAALRAKLPDTPFLVPGYGAQGATAADVAMCHRPDGSGIVVNASRSIIHPTAEAGGWRDAVAQAARHSREELHGASVRG